jgi:hypothetical protein
MTRPNLVGCTTDRSPGLAPGESRSPNYLDLNSPNQSIARRRGAVIRQDVDDRMALRSDSARLSNSRSLSVAADLSASTIVWSADLSASTIV